MRSLWSKVLAVAVSLAIVGVLTSYLPEYVPDVYQVRPGADGVGQIDEVTAEFVDAAAAAGIRPDGDDEKTLTGDDAFVVVRVKLVAHGKTFNPAVGLVTADDYSYTPLDEWGYPGIAPVYIGEYNITSYIFQVPRDKVSGATLLVGPSGALGVQTVRPMIAYPLGELELDEGVLDVPPTERGAVQ